MGFGKIDGIYKNKDKIKSNSTQDKLSKDKKNAFMVTDLATIDIDYFDDKSIDCFRIKNIELEELKK